MHASIHRVDADGVSVFYRESGPPDVPVILLLHEFPASSHMFRDVSRDCAGSAGLWLRRRAAGMPV
jgi:pimeloyl-ACP methyl ester carboxylesterase